MAIVSLKKVTLLALNRDRNKILNALQDFGEMHISEVEDSEDLYTFDNTKTQNEIEETNTLINNVAVTIKDIKVFDDREKPMLAPKPELTLKELDQVVKYSKDITDVVNEHIENNNKVMEIKSELLRLESSYSQIEPWVSLDTDVSIIEDTASCRVIAGTIPVLEATQFSKEIDEIEFAEHQKIYTDRDYVYVLLVYHNKSNEEVATATSKHSFSKFNFSFKSGTPKDQLKIIEKKSRELNKKKDAIKSSEEEMSDSLTEMEKLHDALCVKLDLLEQVEKFGGTEYVFLLEGYISKHEEEKFEKIIADATEGYELTISEAEDDNVPTLYENSAMVAPFESVTNMFATSKSNAYDPNVFMAPFFGLFFGMMLSDAGYGLILFISAMVIYLRTKSSSGKGNSLVAVLAISGISTIFWGIMFGGYMGFTWNPVLFNPLEEPILTLGLSLGLGVIQILTGMTIRAVTLIKRKQVMEAISHHITWITFLIGLVMFAFPMLYTFIGTEPSSSIVAMGQVGKYITLAGLAGIVVLGGYGQKGAGRIFGGLAGIADIPGYFSDILSYARLFGLGLATGVIGMVVNQLAGMVAGSVVGWLFAVIIFVGVHLFNLAINALGAYVHSSRLQYVEFYGKFFEDGGKPFTRFTPQTKYYNIRND